VSVAPLFLHFHLGDPRPRRSSLAVDAARRYAEAGRDGEGGGEQPLERQLILDTRRLVLRLVLGRRSGPGLPRRRGPAPALVLRVPQARGCGRRGLASRLRRNIGRVCAPLGSRLSVAPLSRNNRFFVLGTTSSSSSSLATWNNTRAWDSAATSGGRSSTGRGQSSANKYGSSLSLFAPSRALSCSHSRSGAALGEPPRR
jgi:hypothetical protein